MVAVGDTGMEPAALTVFAGMGRAKPTMALLLGDLSYVRQEEAYCRAVNDRVDAPVAFVPGNHEADDPADGGDDGDIAAYSACLPDRLGASGDYPYDYVLDNGPVRVVMISPGIVLKRGTRTYGDGTPEQAWLTGVIRDAKAAGRWVVVGMHKPCLSPGQYGCSSDPDLTDLLLRERVDVVLAGHEHVYARSHQLTGTAAAARVSDADGRFAAGAGTVFATLGNGGHNPRVVGTPGRLWAATSGSDSTGGADVGYAQLDVTASRLEFSQVATSGPHAGTVRDRFTITA